jgi:hypothetical protein
MWALVHYVRSLSERDEAVAGGPIHGMTPPGEGGGGGN